MTVPEGNPGKVDCWTWPEMLVKRSLDGSHNEVLELAQGKRNGHFVGGIRADRLRMLLEVIKTAMGRD